MGDEPDLRIVRGAPDGEEIAALLVALRLRRNTATAARAEAERAAGTGSRWRGSSLPQRRGLPRPGVHAWRTAM